MVNGKSHGETVPLTICIGLFLAVAAVFGQTIRFDFVNLDDAGYVYDNAQVKLGLTVQGFVQAFTTSWGPYWHPVTWLSHMLDCQIFGTAPAGHHAVNVLFHACNAVLLFLALHHMTRSPWRSAAVAALFAVHPLHVESVAWISERKDVLSTFFLTLALLAYQRYAQLPNVRRYSLVLLLFALGLMSKPMVVTLPLLLLLLDYWPLRRWQPAGASSRGGRRLRLRARDAQRLVLEKLPLLGLSAAVSVVTLLVQRQKGALSTLGYEPDLPVRVANALHAYGAYLFKTLWPTRLAVFYPYLPERPLPGIVAAGCLLLGITAASTRFASRRPYLLVGWLWFLGSLVPVIGLVQAGAQSMADRFTYIPLIGIFIAVVWGACDLADGSQSLRRGLVGAAAAVLIACMAVSSRQVGYWANTETLMRRALEVTPDNVIPHKSLGHVFLGQGRNVEAEAEFRAVLRLDPVNYQHIHGDLGHALSRQGRSEEAAASYREALRAWPDDASIHNNLGLLLASQGEIAGALEHLREALRLEPDRPEALQNVAWILAACPDRAFRNGPEAVRLARRAAELSQRRDPTILRTLADAYLEVGDLPLAAAELRAVLQLAPDDGDAHHLLAATLLALGHVQEAAAHFQEASRLKPR